SGSAPAGRSWPSSTPPAPGSTAPARGTAWTGSSSRRSTSSSAAAPATRSTWGRSRKRPASGTASTSGVSRRCWRAGWSRRRARGARRWGGGGGPPATTARSPPPASGTWDNHGDNIPPYGGISKGLKPLLPIFDHLITTLVADLDERGLLDRTLVLAMGEFGRTPMMGTQGSTDGRNPSPALTSLPMPPT